VSTVTLIGSSASSGGQTFATVTTNADAPAGSRIFFVMAFWCATGQTTGSMTPGTLTWVVDLEATHTNGQDNLFVISADAPSGLPSGTTIQWNGALPATTDGRLVRVLAVTGLTSTRDGAAAASQASATSLSSGSISTTAADFILGASMDDGGSGAMTVGAGYTLIESFHDTTSNESMAIEWKDAPAGSNAATFGSNAVSVQLTTIVAYKRTTILAARPDATISAGNWVTGGIDSGTLHGQLDEAVADDRDYIQSGLSPGSADTVRIGLTVPS
jgi:hypothetical protein